MATKNSNKNSNKATNAYGGDSTGTNGTNCYDSTTDTSRTNGNPAKATNSSKNSTNNCR